MKKILSIAMILAVLCASFVACSAPAEEESKTYNIADVVAAVEAKAPVAMAMDFDETGMEAIFGLTSEDYVEFGGKMSMANTNADTLVVVKAQPDKVDAVVAALTERKDALAAMNEMYLEDQFQKAKNGLVVTKGDYVTLLILGDNDRIMNGEVETIYEELSATLDEAFN